MARRSAATEIGRTPTDVFAVLADVTKNARWASASIEGHLTSPSPVGVGTTAREVTRFLGRRVLIRLATRQFARDLGSLKRRMEAQEI